MSRRDNDLNQEIWRRLELVAQTALRRIENSKVHSKTNLACAVS